MTEKLLLTMDYATVIDGVGGDMQGILAIAVHGQWLWACELAAWVLSYKFPPEVTEAGIMTAELITTCQLY